MHHLVRALIRQHTVDVLVVREPDQPYMERVGNSRILRVPMTDGDFASRVAAFRRALKRQISGADWKRLHRPAAGCYTIVTSRLRVQSKTRGFGAPVAPGGTFVVPGSFPSCIVI
jgi:hypothetical protein